MPDQRVEIPARFAGYNALFFIAFVTLAAFIALATKAGDEFNIGQIFSDPYLARVIRFTLWQAALSTLLSVGLAIPTARALARQTNFPGRQTLLKLLALPLALPALVGVLAILGLWGASGWINALTGNTLTFSIFGLSGILIAHVFFNLPLATRMFLSRLERVPVENWRLASQLSMSSGSIFKLIEWPALKTGLASILALVFMLCLTSFTIVLTLGGGPASTTLEVAIYQSLRFDFDPGRAVTLALVQLAITALFLILSFRFTKTLPDMISLKTSTPRPDAHSRSARIIDASFIIATGSFVVLPLITLIADGLSADLIKLLTSQSVWNAIATSFVLALGAGTLSVLLCWSMLKAIPPQNGNQHSPFAKLVNFTSSTILVMPAIVLGSGWFILLHQYGDVFSFAPVLVIVINALMALPFVHRILAPALAESNQKHQRLITALGITGWARWRLIDYRLLKKPLMLAFAFAMALSLGDLGVIALFGSEKITTLPLLLFKSLGSYRTNDAQGLALILALCCLLVLYVAEKISRKEPRRC